MTDLMTIADGELSASVAVRGAELFSRFAIASATICRMATRHGGPPVPDALPGRREIARRQNPHRRQTLSDAAARLRARARPADLAEREARRNLSRVDRRSVDPGHVPVRVQSPDRIRCAGRQARDRVDRAQHRPGADALRSRLSPCFPLAGRAGKAPHVYLRVFEKPEPAPILHSDLATGLLRRERFPSPVAGKTLRLANSQFEEGAMQFDAVRSRRVWFGPAGAEGIDVRFPDSPQLGIWTKPGAPYLCIEPWQGLAEREGASGELRDRPGTRILDPGASAGFRLVVRPGVRDECRD